MIHTGILRPLCVVSLLMVAALGAGGCGSEADPEEAIWGVVERIDMETGPQLAHLQEQGEEQRMQLVHQMRARGLESVLENHPDAPEQLRAVLAEVLETERALAEGEASNRRAVRQQLLEDWSYLAERQLPPGR